MDTIVKNYVDGNFVTSNATETVEVINPATLEVLGHTPLGTKDDVDMAVAAAEEAYKTWSKTPVIDRLQPFFRLKALMEANLEEIATLIVKENGKTFVEGKGDILRGKQMIEVACGMANLMMGECLENIAVDIDCTAIRRPLGVFTGITPFNFPAMVPLWFWPFAVATGNTFILKPSERVPLTQVRLFELIDEAGFPPGVVNMVQGAKDVVNSFLTHPDVKGVSFVGSTPVAKHVYSTGTANGKRVQALGGAKNFLVILPDAPMEKSVKAMVDSCYGCAGERCLAGAVIVTVGDSHQEVRDLVLDAANNVVVGNGLDPQTTMGPVISQQAKERIHSDIETAIDEGAEMLMDGRNIDVPGLDGYFIGPTVFDKVKPNTLLSTKEIFGPVISLMQVDSLDDAIELINSSPYGNTTSIFTSNGGAARYFTSNVNPSMVGVNLGVPAPMAFFSFGGSKDSFFGDVKAHGNSSVEFYTEKHAVMSRWFQEGVDAVASPMWHSEE
ncbi:MAG: CoA-acylating methylmalonate-semialdehyde dehydrogenase [bacterium]|nr:CoA-acylating methylmalonate-semialdehyde dehydrogenase [bacterium]